MRETRTSRLILTPELHRLNADPRYVTELAAAGIAAARAVRPDLPITAYLLEHNLASKAVAERLGLRLVWRGPDAGNPDPRAVRLVYADRDIEPERLGLLTARGR